ncbi:MAG: HAD family hydrolase [Armatimonadetes bacterium]|nr:HAD family hydrolase [Armatimonadota bacterium]
MPSTVITIDFWQTLFDDSGGPQRNLERQSALGQAIADAGYFRDIEEVDTAFRSIWEYFDHHWLNNQRTPTSREMVEEICRRLDLALPDDAVAQVTHTFANGVLSNPPALLPGVRDALAFLANRAPLALISDTAFSPGQVLRSLMEQQGIASYFSNFIFSDESGVAKPHPDAFRRAVEPLGGDLGHSVHIGDIERTDIRGAKGVGMKAILYRGNHIPHKYADDGTESAADAVIRHWEEMLEVWERMK